MRSLPVFLFVLASLVPAAAQQADFVALSLEVTQGVQDLDNSVRLVANKRTFVRFHVRSTADGEITTATLTARAGGKTVTLAPVNENAEIAVPARPNRGVTDDAFLFELPGGFRSGTVQLSAEVNPSAGAEGRPVAEANTANNTASTEVSFEAVPQLNLVISMVDYIDKNGQRVTTKESDARMMVNWLTRAWPVSSVRFWLRRDDISKSIGAGLPTCRQVNSLLMEKRAISLQNPSSTIPSNARYYGMVDDRGGFMRGCANGLPGFASSGPTGVAPSATGYASWDTDGVYGDWYGAHEVAHNFMRYHAEFCNAQAGSAFPYPDGRISPSLTGNAAVFGFDWRNLSVYNANWKDNMTYCTFQWNSKFTYEGLMDALQSNILPEAVATAQKARMATGGQELLFVEGSIDASRQPLTAELSPLVVLPNSIVVSPRKAGDYAIVLKAGATELANYRFTPVAMSSGPGENPDDPELKLLAIDQQVPYVQGTTRVEIQGPANQLLAFVEAGQATPVVKVNAPSGGERLAGDTIRVSWDATDADPGDKLYFTVQYSADGGLNWETVDQDITGVNSTDIDRFDIAASSNALFRVIASDGIHTGIAQTAAPFTVLGVSPVAELVRPLDDEAFLPGETVTLEAYAYDADTGDVPDEKIKWSSSIDGPLGTGELLAVTGLKPGLHTITLTVDDESDAPATVLTTRINVVASAAQLPLVADKLLAAPDAVFLSPAEPKDTLDIWNRNRRKSIAWTAEVNRPWLKLSAVAGSTPAEVEVSLGELSGVPAGSTQVGNVTITNPANGEKQVVRVQVTVPR